MFDGGPETIVTREQATEFRIYNCTLKLSDVRFTRASDAVKINRVTFVGFTVYLFEIWLNRGHNDYRSFKEPFIFVFTEKNVTVFYKNVLSTGTHINFSNHNRWILKRLRIIGTLNFCHFLRLQ